MSIQQIMGILYPLLAATSFGLLLSLVGYWYWERRIRMVIAAICYLVTEFASMMLLSLSTGASPILDIAIVRPWIVLVRVLMLGADVWLVVEVFLALYRKAKRMP